MNMISNADFYGGFNDYATKHLGLNTTVLNEWQRAQNMVYANGLKVFDSLTPYILEEREMRAVQMDIFSRLMKERTIWINGVINDTVSTIVQAQLLYLNSVDSDSDITIHVDTPGGSVKSGLSIIDSMELSDADIITINTGMAASMGSVLLAAGTKGKRKSMRHSKIMLHQVSSGMQGNVQDTMIVMNESLKYNEELFRLLGSYCGKDPEQVKNDANRDFWLSPEEGLEYGLIDEILIKK